MVAKLERETFADGRPDGWASTTKLPLRDDRGNIVGTWGIARNITSQIEAEQALAAREAQYRSLFEHNPQPMFAYDRDTLQIIAVSNSAIAAYGYTGEELLAMTINDLMPAEGRRRCRAPAVSWLCGRGTAVATSVQGRDRHRCRGQRRRRDHRSARLPAKRSA